MKNLFLKHFTHIVISLGIVLLVLVAVAPSYYFFTKYQKSQQLLNNPTQAAKQEVGMLIERIGKVMELPAEEATIATVSDKDKLNNQPFFAKAENGDKVLIYTQARKAILWRPTTGRIIEVSTINLSAEPIATASPSAVAQKTKVVLLNGTLTVGLTNTAEKKLLSDAKIGTLIAVIEKEETVKPDYAKTLVIDVSGTYTDLAASIANILGADIGVLPEGETSRNGDILVILGSDTPKK